MTYVGRFAPSPTGPLHFGSLVTAVASYLHARQAGGRWLIRIEDIDPPREVAGAADEILRTLELFALDWDGPVIYQSRSAERHWAAVQRLLLADLAYRCICTRKALRQFRQVPNVGPHYPGTCSQLRIDRADAAVRVRAGAGARPFVDLLQGETSIDVAALCGDYMIYRKDGLPAYHLAVVLDDADQGVTHILRGSDLLPSTGIHLHLADVLALDVSWQFAHLPIVTDAAGEKLSKQQGATALDPKNANALAALALRVLGADPPPDVAGGPPATLWQWAQQNWDITQLRGRAAAVAPPEAL